MVDVKKVEAMAAELGNDVMMVAKELKRVQSIKCRLLKQKGRSDYAEKLTETLSYEQLLKEVRNFLEPKDKPVTMYTQADVDMIDDYDEINKAIKSIQSKKTNTQWLTDVQYDNDEYRSACAIEEMLLARKSELKPVADGLVRKTDVQTIIDTIESSGKISQKEIVRLLKELVE